MERIVEEYEDPLQMRQRMKHADVLSNINPAMLIDRIKGALILSSMNNNNNNEDDVNDDDDFGDAKTYEKFMRLYGKELNTQEERYQKQVDELTLALAKKQEEVRQLSEQLEKLKDDKNDLESTQHDAKINDITLQLQETAKQLDAVKRQLESSQNESEAQKEKLDLMKEELKYSKQMNSALQSQANLSSKETARMAELETKIVQVEDKLTKVMEERDTLQTTLKEIEAEREDEIKIIQDALDEADKERDELIKSFEKELQNVGQLHTAREAKLLEDFEWKFRQMEKDTNKLLGDKDSKHESTLHRSKRHQDDEEFRQKQEKLRNELNAEWEDKLRSECSRLKGELDDLHSEEKHLAVESMKVQKEQEIHTLKKSWDLKQEAMTKEISTLKDSLTNKDAYYHNELENSRTSADRDIWELRRKLQKLDESSQDLAQSFLDKKQEELEIMRLDYEERLEVLEARLALCDAEAGMDARHKLEHLYKQQVEHLGEQHRNSMERLREELEAEKFQAVEEARVIVSKHLEYVNATLRDQLTEAVTNNNQYRDELEALRLALSRREEVMRSLEDELSKLKGTPVGQTYSTSQFSIDSCNDSHSSHGSSQDRLSISDSLGAAVDDDAQKSSGGLLGKMFGSGWFSASKPVKEAPSPMGNSSRRGSAPSNNGKKSRSSS